MDILIIGAGTAGLPAAIFAARAGASVVVIDAADEVGGTLHLSAGQISASCTPVQRERGIADDPDRHLADIMRISRGSADPALTRLAVDHVSPMLAWLVESGLELPVEHPVIDPVNEAYSVPRTYWPREGGRAILRVILPQFEAERARGRIDLRLKTKLTRLIVEDDRVVGAEVETVDGARTLRARSVILATGGFTADADMFARMTNGQARHGSGYRFAKGEGLAASLAIGGMATSIDKFLPAFAAVENPDARDGYAFDTRINLDARPPWEVYVDLDGRRFMREDEPALNERQRALLRARQLQFWAIYDAGVVGEAPPFSADGSWATLDAAFGANRPGYVRAGSWAELAAGMNIDAPTLVQTIGGYNEALIARTADPFERVHRPRAITEAPFYAIRHSGWSPTGFAGLAIDDQLRVIDERRQPIAGLYAAGEIIGMAATAGRSYCSGMSVGPALAFGRLLGKRLGAETSMAKTQSEA